MCHWATAKFVQDIRIIQKLDGALPSIVFDVTSLSCRDRHSSIRECWITQLDACHLRCLPLEAGLLDLLLKQSGFIEGFWQEYYVIHKHWLLGLDGQGPAARVEHKWQRSYTVGTNNSLEAWLLAGWQDQNLTLLGLSIRVGSKSNVGVHVVPIEADITCNDLVQSWLVDVQIKQDLFLDIREDGIASP